jgi:hypothetical protein
MAGTRRIHRVVFAIALGIISTVTAGFLGMLAEILYGGIDHIPTDYGVLSGAVSGILVAWAYCAAIARRKATSPGGFPRWGALYGLIAALISSMTVHISLMVAWQRPAFGNMLIGTCFALVVGPVLGLIAGFVWGKWLTARPVGNERS